MVSGKCGIYQRGENGRLTGLVTLLNIYILRLHRTGV